MLGVRAEPDPGDAGDARPPPAPRGDPGPKPPAAPKATLSSGGRRPIGARMLPEGGGPEDAPPWPEGVCVSGCWWWWCVPSCRSTRECSEAASCVCGTSTTSVSVSQLSAGEGEGEGVAGSWEGNKDAKGGLQGKGCNTVHVIMRNI